MAAGFFRRKLLLAIGGWNDETGSGSADVELALLMSALELVCECEPNVLITASPESVPNRSSQQAIRELAAIAAAHGIASASFAATVSSIITATLTGTISSALAWSSGLKNTALALEVTERLAFAKKQLAASQEAVSIKLQSSNLQSRRAA